MSSKWFAILAIAACAVSVQAGQPDWEREVLFEAGAEETPTGIAPAGTAAPRLGAWGFDISGMDRSVKPGDDFFRYASGNWAARTQIPGDKTSVGAFVTLRDLSEARVRAIVERWAADGTLRPGSDEAKVAAAYRTFMDEVTVERLDAKPIARHLEAVRLARTHNDMARIMGRSRSGFGASFFAPMVGDDARRPDRYALYLGQSGLGLPDREYYLREEFQPQRARYEKYVADMLRLAGWDEPERRAAQVMALETKLAAAHWTRAESRNRDRTYTAMTLGDLEVFAPGFPWTVYFRAAGMEVAGLPVVRQNTAFPKMAEIFAVTDLDTLKAWQAFHVTDDAAPMLSRRFADAHWEFRSKFLNGVPEQRERWKRALSHVEGAMGEAIGRAYVAQYFPASSKAKMEKLVADLRTAMKQRIERLEWMGPETKGRALEKLARFGVKIGYPSKWRDYSKLRVVEGELAGNFERSRAFEWAEDVSRIGRLVDEKEWGMTPQTVNAYYRSTRNEIVFPAAILQPPFFDPEADPAVNYGAIGGVIGHEITHGFDDQGRKSDGHGVLRDWWEADDAAKFEEQATRLGAQYEAYDFPKLPGLRIIPKLTMGENIGDLGGILLGLDAYRISLGESEAPVLDGFTGEQRVFLGWAQVWRSLMRDDALRQQLMTNSHSPGYIRAFAPLRNVDAWYDAFDVKEGDANYLRPEDRVRIW